MKLAVVIKSWRTQQELSLRDAAKQIGIGATVLHKIEDGRSMDAHTLAAILRWLTMEL